MSYTVLTTGNGQNNTLMVQLRSIKPLYAHQSRRVLVWPEGLWYGPMPNWHPCLWVRPHVDEFVATVPRMWAEG